MLNTLKKMVREDTDGEVTIMLTTPDQTNCLAPIYNGRRDSSGPNELRDLVVSIIIFRYNFFFF